MQLNVACDAPFQPHDVSIMSLSTASENYFPFEKKKSNLKHSPTPWHNAKYTFWWSLCNNLQHQLLFTNFLHFPECLKLQASVSELAGVQLPSLREC